MRNKFAFLLLFALISLAACNKSANKIVGKWNIKGVSGLTFEFKPDGTFSSNGDMAGMKMVMSGKYSSTDKDLTMTPTSMDMSSSDPKLQAVIDASKQQTQDKMKTPVTVQISWTSADEFVMSNTSGWAKMGNGGTTLQRAK